MNTPTHTDDELVERISRGDWGVDVEPPELDDVMRLVAQRERRRRTAIGVGVGAGLAAAAATVIVGLAPADTHTTDVPSATEPTASAPRTPAPPQPVDCRHASRLLLTQGRYGGTPQRPSQVAVVQNISARACSLTGLPTLRIGNQSGETSRVDAGSAGDGRWELQPDDALFLTVTAAPPSSCTGAGRTETSRQFIIEFGDGYTYTFNFPGMQVDGCTAPVLTRVRVAPRS